MIAPGSHTPHLKHLYFNERRTAGLATTGCVATLGNFDGVHRGHQALIELAVKEGDMRGLPAVALSFFPHPQQVLQSGVSIPLLTRISRKCELLQRMGLDELCLLRFNCALSKLSAESFVKNYLFDNLDVRLLIIGPDARVGHARRGTPGLLSTLFKAAGREVLIAPFCQHGEERISSRRVRNLLLNGEVQEARQLLGRDYSLDGKVVHGDARGATIGFPTANLSLGRLLVPKLGVYITRCILAGNVYTSVTNVGVRPTVDGRSVCVESHLLDAQLQPFYGARLSVEFIARLRDEIRFNSLDELRAQIASDVATARQRHLELAQE